MSDLEANVVEFQADSEGFMLPEGFSVNHDTDQTVSIECNYTTNFRQCKISTI